MDKAKPIREFYSQMGRFSHLTEGDYEHAQQMLNKLVALIEKLAPRG